MDKANTAEWLLRRVVDPARASELVGDQLEAQPTAGGLRFWMSIAQLMLMFSWRTLAGVAASPVAGIVLALCFFAGLHSREAVGLSQGTVLHVQIYLLGVSVLLWAATVFSLVRLGWRNPLTGVGLAASVLWSVSSSFFWQRTPAIVLAVLWVGFLVFCAIRAKRRRALGILCVAVGAAWLTAFALSVIPHDPYSVFGKWQGLAALFLIPIVESKTTLFLHRKLIAPQNSGR